MVRNTVEDSQGLVNTVGFTDCVLVRPYHSKMPRIAIVRIERASLCVGAA